MEVSNNAWNGRIWNCFGKCQPDDILTLSTVSTMPSVAYGYTYHKSMKHSFWGQTLAFFSFFTLLQVIFIAVYGSKCGRYEISHYYHTYENGTVIEHTGPHNSYSSCNEMGMAFAIVLLLVSLCGCLYCGIRRMSFRKTYNLPGNGVKDLASWIFCAPCTLCQEMRTSLELERMSTERMRLNTAPKSQFFLRFA